MGCHLIGIRFATTLCYAVGFMAAARTASYSEGHLRIRIFDDLSSLLSCSCWALSTLALVFWSAQLIGTGPALVALGQLAIFPILAVVDLQVRKVPTLLVEIGSIWTLLVLGARTGVGSDGFAMLLACAYMTPLLLVNMVHKGSLGAGDIRLGIYVGPVLAQSRLALVVPEVLVIASVLALAFAGVYRVVARRSIIRIPLVPFILGAIVMVQL